MKLTQLCNCVSAKGNDFLGGIWVLAYQAYEKSRKPSHLLMLIFKGSLSSRGLVAKDEMVCKSEPH